MKYFCLSVVLVGLVAFVGFAITPVDEVQKEVQQDFVNLNVADLMDLGVDPCFLKRVSQTSEASFPLLDPELMSLDCSVAPILRGCLAFNDCRDAACGPACTCTQCYLRATLVCDLFRDVCVWTSLEYLSCLGGRDACWCLDTNCLC